MKYQVTTPPTSLRSATSPRKGRLDKTPHLRRQGEYANHRSFGGLLALPVTCPYRAEAEGSPGLAGGHNFVLFRADCQYVQTGEQDVVNVYNNMFRYCFLREFLIKLLCKIM